MIKARDRADLKVALAADAQIAGVVKASLSDIKQGSFVGVTAMPKADGPPERSRSPYLPEAMRGTGRTYRGIFSRRAQCPTPMLNRRSPRLMSGNADVEVQGRRKENLCPREHAHCCLCARGQERSQT